MQAHAWRKVCICKARIIQQRLKLGLGKHRLGKWHDNLGPVDTQRQGLCDGDFRSNDLDQFAVRLVELGDGLAGSGQILIGRPPQGAQSLDLQLVLL